MNPILAILKEHNVSDEKVKALFEAFTQNPMMAMALVQELGIPPEKLQQLMAVVMTQPHLIKEAVTNFGSSTISTALDCKLIDKKYYLFIEKMYFAKNRHFQNCHFFSKKVRKFSN